VALLVDAVAGEPAWLYRRVPHPVVLMGRLAMRLEARLWRDGQTAAERRAAGRRLVAWTVALAGGAGLVLMPLLAGGPWGWVVAGVLASSLVAQRSLVDHVGAVAQGLDVGLEAGRAAVARIVGRDPDRLDAAGVARAAVESAAENFADGVTAPLFWWLVLGPLGLAGYKAVNTLDSMVGYRSVRYLDFGRAAARLDDRANWLPARLTALLLLLAAGRPGAWRGLRAEARKHRSPNAGWPEAAMARLLGLRLAGPRVYAAGVVDDAWIGTGRTAATAADIRAAVRRLWAAWALVVALLAAALVLL
jgi:adenosylcobinamide-phosphate synthase